MKKVQKTLHNHMTWQRPKKALKPQKISLFELKQTTTTFQYFNILFYYSSRRINK